MRLTLVLWFALSSIANGDDASLIWSIPGQISPKTKVIYPISQEPFLATEERLIVGFPPDYVLGTNPRTGKRVWIWPFLSSESSLQSRLRPRGSRQVWGPRAVSFSIDARRKQVLSLNRDGAIAALDWSRDGYLRWHAGGDRSADAKLSSYVALGVPCIHADSAFYLAEANSRLLLAKIDLGTGELESQTQLAEHEGAAQQPCCYSPIICGDHLVVPLPTGELLALDADSLEEKWRIDTDGLLTSIFRLMCIDSQICVASGQRCEAYALGSGHALWSRKSVSAFPFVIADDKLILREDDAICCIEIKSGETKWTTRPNFDVVANGAVDGDRLILPTTNAIRAFRLSDGTNTATYSTPITLGHLFLATDGIYSVSASRLDKLSLPAPIKRDSVDP